MLALCWHLVNGQWPRASLVALSFRTMHGRITANALWQICVRTCNNRSNCNCSCGCRSYCIWPLTAQRIRKICINAPENALRPHPMYVCVCLCVLSEKIIFQFHASNNLLIRFAFNFSNFSFSLQFSFLAKRMGKSL